MAGASVRLRVLCLAAAVYLSACQAPPVPPDSVGHVAEGDRAVRLAGPVPLDGMRFVRFVDRWQVEDYGTFDRDGVTAEVVLLAANPGDTVALDFRLSTKEAIETFSALSGSALSWAPATAVPGWRRQLFYRAFTHTAANRDCVGFAGGWQVITEDPEMRPRNAVFGYVCNPPAVPMTAADALAVVGNIRVDPSAAWRPVQQQDWSGDAGALSLVHGSVERGNPSFPFRLARFYVVANGRSGFK